MKQLIGPLAVLAVLVLGFGIALWAPWDSETRERELAWLRTLAGWVEAAPQHESPAACGAEFDQVVGPPPSERLRPAGEIARDGCRASESADDWLTVEWRIRSNLIDGRFAAADTIEEPALASAVRGFAGQTVRVNCWPDESWAKLNEEWNIFARDEFWGLLGFADTPRGAIHLGPQVCEPLRLFFEGSYEPYLNEQSLDLATSLVTLVHEAEHVRHPFASEATVECFAMQDIRELVRDAGRRPSYATEMAGLSWDIGYPHMPGPYRTRDCRDGGRLDRHPLTSVWP